MKGKWLTHELDHKLAPPMFAVSLIALGLFAVLFYLNDLAEVGGYIVRACVAGLAVCYVVCWAETVAHTLSGSPRMKQHIWFCLLPICRLGARDHETGKMIWLPSLGWREAARPLERLLARGFSIPMIVIALSVLPIIVLEFFWSDYVEATTWLQVTMDIAEAFIWSAFTFEFVLMISVVKYPMAYVRKHWIDLAIILLPMIAFLRAVRLTALLRLNNVARTAKVFRLRGLALRMWRGIVALEVVEMLLLRNPERRLEKLEVQLEDKLEEIEDLQREINRVQKRVDERAEKLAAEKVDVVDQPAAESATARDMETITDSSTDPSSGLRSA